MGMIGIGKPGEEPLVKIERPSGNLGQHAHVIGLVAVLAVAVAVYVAGIILSMPLLTGAALFIGLFGVLGFMFVKRKFGISPDIDVEEEMERYRSDLVDTFNGYEVEYTSEDIEKAMEEYREILERETVSVSDINITTMSKVVSDNMRKHKEEKAGRKRRGKKGRSAFDDEGNVVKLRDLR